METQTWSPCHKRDRPFLINLILVRSNNQSIVFVWATWRNCVFSSWSFLLGLVHTHSALSSQLLRMLDQQTHNSKRYLSTTTWDRLIVGFTSALSLLSEKTQLNYTYLTHNHQERAPFIFGGKNTVVCCSTQFVCSVSVSTLFCFNNDS